jgi:hypothetical protein
MFISKLCDTKAIGMALGKRRECKHGLHRLDRVPGGGVYLGFLGLTYGV